MKDFLKKYIPRHVKFRELLPQTPSQPEENLEFNRYKLSAKKRIWLQFVSISHWVCLAGFAVSVFLVNGMGFNPEDWAVPYSDKVFDPLEMLKMLCVSGLIGYGTNYIAIQMLFRPVHKRPVWGQGLIPAQRQIIIFTLSRGMHKHVLNEELIIHNLEKAKFPARLAAMIIDSGEGVVRDEELKKEVKYWIVEGIRDYFSKTHVQNEILATIDEKLDVHLEGGLKKLLVSTYRKYNAKDYESLVKKFIQEIPEITGSVMDKFGAEKTDEIVDYLHTQKGELTHLITVSIADILTSIDITGLLRKQMEHFDDSKLEKMVREATNEQLKYIQYLGTLLGLLGGLIIWEPVFMLIVYSVILATLFILDKILYQRQNPSHGK